MQIFFPIQNKKVAELSGSYPISDKKSLQFRSLKRNFVLREKFYQHCCLPNLTTFSQTQYSCFFRSGIAFACSLLSFQFTVCEMKKKRSYAIIWILKNHVTSVFFVRLHAQYAPITIPIFFYILQKITLKTSMQIFLSIYVYTLN